MKLTMKCLATLEVHSGKRKYISDKADAKKKTDFWHTNLFFSLRPPSP